MTCPASTIPVQNHSSSAASSPEFHQPDGPEPSNSEWRAETKRRTSRSLAARLIDQALPLSSSKLHHHLLLVADTGLLESIPILHHVAERLTERFESMESRLGDAYPMCYRGARHLLNREGLTLAEEVDLYRSETFWTKAGPESLLRSEELILDLYRLYSETVSLLRQIDSCNEDGIEERSFPDLTVPPNPYEQLVGS